MLSLCFYLVLKTGDGYQIGRRPPRQKSPRIEIKRVGDLYLHVLEVSIHEPVVTN